MERTELAELGEFGLIKHLTQNLKLKHKSSLLGVGDDAAVISPDKEKIVLSSDMLLEGVHFNLSYTPLKHLGYKAIAVNLSDIYAMNAEPKQVTVSLGLSNRFSVEAVEELYEGIILCCENYQVDLVGGDTVSSVSGLVLSITVVGHADADDLVYRNGAQAGDLLCVSGDLGASFMGLQLLERERHVFQEDPKIQPDLSGKEYVLERQLKPEPRADIVRLLRELEVMPSSMIDVSDGLASELFHLSDASGLGCKIYEEKIPIDPMTDLTADEFKMSPVSAALNGGEDYELLFTVKQQDYEKIKDNKDISVIGHMCDIAEGLHLITRVGEQIPLKAQGWNAFEKKSDD